MSNHQNISIAHTDEFVDSRMPSQPRISRIAASTFTFLLPSMLVLIWLLCLPCSYGWIADIARCRLSSRSNPNFLSHGSTVVAFSAVSNAAENRAIPAAGIPRELENLGLLESLDCDEDDYSRHPLGVEPVGKDRKRRVERVSMDPPVFILRNAISPEECFHIRTVALSMETAMEDGKTVSDGAKTNDPSSNPTSQPEEQPREQPRKHSRVGWLENDKPAIEAIARRAHGIFLNGMPFHATRGIEPLQIVHYHCEGGEYVNHHDSNGRLLTVLYYLNGVGKTWFPLAEHDDPQYQQQHRHEINDLTEARQACIGRSPGENGVLVTCRKGADGGDDDETPHAGPGIARVKEGDAVAFYNYRVDGSMNWKAFHSGLPVTKEDLVDEDNRNKNAGGKWIANHFYHFVPSHIPETPPPE